MGGWGGECAGRGGGVCGGGGGGGDGVEVGFLGEGWFYFRIFAFVAAWFFHCLLVMCLCVEIVSRIADSESVGRRVGCQTQRQSGRNGSSKREAALRNWSGRKDGCFTAISSIRIWISTVKPLFLGGKIAASMRMWLKSGEQTLHSSYLVSHCRLYHIWVGRISSGSRIPVCGYIEQRS